MPHRVGERRFLAEEDIAGEIVPLLKGVAQKILALAVDVHLPGGIDRHDVSDKVEIAERDARLHRIDGDAAVGAQHVVHVQLPDALFRLLLELLGRGREVGILIAEQLVGDLPRQQHAHVGGEVDLTADEVHAHARADGRNVVCAERFDDEFQRLQHVLARHIDLGMLAADIVGDFPCVL